MAEMATYVLFTVHTDDNTNTNDNDDDDTLIFYSIERIFFRKELILIVRNFFCYVQVCFVILKTYFIKKNYLIDLNLSHNPLFATVLPNTIPYQCHQNK
jgi:hypothetical protein